MPTNLYRATVFLSAFLLFLIEPIAAKTILPALGGSSAVWLTCLVFFQLILLLGYLYAHLLTRYAASKNQPRIHLTLVAAAVLVSLIHLIHPPSLSNASEHPVAAIFTYLSATIGLPFLLLASTSPMLQTWLARRTGGAIPYRLFALSNAGSLLALILYPTVIEPNLALHHQTLSWTLAFLLAATLYATIARQNSHKFGCPTLEAPHSGESRVGQTKAATSSLNGPVDLPPGQQTPFPIEPTRGLDGPERLSLRRKLLWILLPLAAATQLSAVTAHLSQNIAAIPLLWILPLAAYLLSFILAFDAPRLYRSSFGRPIVIRLLIVLLASLGYMLTKSDASLPILLSIAFFLIELFLACYFLHAETYTLRPTDPAEATTFYLLIASGGVAGSFLIGIASPLIFSANYDIAISFALTAFAALLATWNPENNATEEEALTPTAKRQNAQAAGIWAQRLLWITGTLLLCAVIAMMHTAYAHDSVAQVRNFYASLRVRETHLPPEAFTVRTLQNGSIQHGTQWFAPEFRHNPTTYYAPNSGIGLALTHCCPNRPRNIGVIGLGAGTIAAYANPPVNGTGDHITFYEINPAVLPIAQHLFTYLRDSPAKIDIVQGDARVSLQKQKPQAFDVLAIDAFSGDAIPLHLLTTQALQLYKQHLAPGGILAFHVSNQYLNLAPEVALLAASAGMQAREVQSPPDNQGAFSSTWVLVTNNNDFLTQPELTFRAKPIQPIPNLKPWTDDYSTLLPILQWKSR